MAGLDGGAYERLRNIYNSLDIPGPNIVGAEDMEIATLCKHPFCRWAWFWFSFFVLGWVGLVWVASGYRLVFCVGFWVGLTSGCVGLVLI